MIQEQKENKREINKKLDKLEVNSIVLGVGDTAFKLNKEGGWTGREKSTEAPFRFDLEGNVWIEKIRLKTISEPTTPPSGEAHLYLDTTTGNFNIKFSNGVIKTIATP